MSLIKLSDAHVEQIIGASRKLVNANNDVYEAAKSLLAKSELPENYNAELQGYMKKSENASNESVRIMRDVSNASSNLKEALDKIANTAVDTSVADVDGSAVKSKVGHLL